MLGEELAAASANATSLCRNPTCVSFSQPTHPTG